MASALAASTGTLLQLNLVRARLRPVKGTEMLDQPTGPDQVRQLFDSKAEGWPAKYGPQGPLAERLMQFADQVAASVPAGGRLLDLGCGTGELARYLAASGFRVTGCDISSEMMRRAIAADQSGDLTWLLISADWQTLPITTGSFDAIVAASVLEYVSSPDAVFRECARLLRPGGFLFSTVPDITHPIRWLEWAASFAGHLLKEPTGIPVSRPARYLTYLRLSAHRRSVHWWSAAAESAGLFLAHVPGHPPRRSPLRLLAFQRPIGDRAMS